MPPTPIHFWGVRKGRKSLATTGAFDAHGAFLCAMERQVAVQNVTATRMGGAACVRREGRATISGSPPQTTTLHDSVRHVGDEAEAQPWTSGYNLPPFAAFCSCCPDLCKTAALGPGNGILHGGALFIAHVQHQSRTCWTNAHSGVGWGHALPSPNLFH